MPSGWTPEGQDFAGEVPGKVLTGAVQADLSAGGLSEGGLELTREAHLYTSLVRTLRGAPAGALEGILPDSDDDVAGSMRRFHGLASLRVLRQAHHTLLQAGAQEGAPTDDDQEEQDDGLDAARMDLRAYASRPWTKDTPQSHPPPSHHPSLVSFARTSSRTSCPCDQGPCGTAWPL